MKLISLKLHNFRQFYGNTPIIKFGVGSQNVTVILGENGAGKTAMLNALTWLLYDSYTRGFEEPEKKVNLRAIAEASIGATVHAWAELIFEHGDVIYQLRRQADAIKVSEDNWEFKPDRPSQLMYAEAAGEWKQEDKVTDAIGRILPKDLHYYFFFDGERIERIVRPTKKEKSELASATKRLLGIEVLDRAISHLKDARIELEKELKRIGDPETQKLLGEKEALENEQAEQQAQLEQHQSNLDGFCQNKKEVEDRLRVLEGVKHLQLRRDQLNEDRDARIASLRQTEERLKQAIARDGYTVFVEDIAKQFRALIETLREKGELPVGIKQRFVQDLLDHGTCICKRTLAINEDSKARSAVEAWMQKAGIDEVEKAAAEMGVLIDGMAEKIPEFWETVAACQAKEDTDRTEISQIDDELDKIRKQLDGSPREEVSDLQKRLSQLEEDIGQTNQGIGAANRMITRIEQEILEKQDAINKLEGKKQEQDLAARRVRAAIDARDRIKLVYENLNETLRRKLEARINLYFHQISVTPYVARLDSSYSLELYDQAINVPLPIARSQGESQVLCLSFIAGFVDLAREWIAKREDLPGPDSAEYPIVMDSPFGALDTTNRRHVAEHINKVADQVTMMLSSTQWRGEVADSSTSKIGEAYIFSYYTSKKEFEGEVSIDLNGQVYPLVRKSPNGFEYTEVIEVDNG
jgi:DNA sulfur modification protein DndD